MPELNNEQLSEQQKELRQRRVDLTKTTIEWLELMTELLEIIISLVILVGFFMAVIPLIADMPGLLSNDNAYSFDVFLNYAFTLVIGIEFVRMLVKHTPSSALQVLLFAIARHLVLDGGSGVDLVLGVAAIAGIFAIRKFLYVHSFESRDDGSAFTWFRSEDLVRHKTEREIIAETRKAEAQAQVQQALQAQAADQAAEQVESTQQSQQE